MGSSSSWKTRVEKGIPKSPSDYDDTSPNAGVGVETSGVGEGARKQGAGLVDAEACADEDTDEDD